MIKAQKIFSYLNHTISVTKDGEQYVVLCVIYFGYWFFSRFFY